MHLSPTVAHWSSAAIAVPAAAVSKRVAKNFMMTFGVMLVSLDGLSGG